MSAQSDNGYSQACTLELPVSLDAGGLRLNNYLLESTQKLDAITELVCQGEVADRNSRNWMLAQVDFIVETIGSEGLKLDDDLRSKLLQLLLEIANLNEHIRRQASLSL